MTGTWTQDGYMKAYLFAARAHKDKPWPGDPSLNYMVHVTLVSIEVIKALQAEPEHDGDLAVKCALLHDVIEDTEISYEQIKAEFGLRVADGVQALTKNGGINGKKLKIADYLARIQQQPHEVWLVKMADRIVNLQPPPKDWDKAHISEYQEESNFIYDQLKPASKYLADRLADKIQSYGQYIVQND